MAARITHAHENVDPGDREGVAHPERRQIEVVVDRGHGGDEEGTCGGKGGGKNRSRAHHVVVSGREWRGLLLLLRNLLAKLQCHLANGFSENPWHVRQSEHVAQQHAARAGPAEQAARAMRHMLVDEELLWQAIDDIDDVVDQAVRRRGRRQAAARGHDRASRARELHLGPQLENFQWDRSWQHLAALAMTLHLHITCGRGPTQTRGNALASHTIPNTAIPPVCIPHPGQIVNVGSRTVKVNGLGIARVGDSADGGAIVAKLGNVFAGG